MKTLWVAVLFVLGCLAIPSAKAQQWVMCDSCVSTAQFELAAIQRHGERSGWMTYAVANTQSKRFMYVEVVYTRPGDVIMSERNTDGVRQEAYRSFDRNGSFTVIQLNTNPGEHVVGAESGALAALIEAQSGGHQSSSVEPTSGERAQFEAIVSLARDQVLFTAPIGNSAFASYQTATLDYLAMVDSAIRVAMTAQNPAWVNQEMSPNLVRTLWNALEQHNGKGPTGCIIFHNGDSACFQINPLAPGAPRVIAGTVKDINGNPIPAGVQTVPNGGGRGLAIEPNTPSSGQTSWGPVSGGGSWWLICSTQGGKPIECYVTYVPE